APDLATAARGIISLASEYGEADRPLEIAVEALRRHPDQPEALETAGWGLTLGGFPDYAVRALDRVLKVDPANASASWYRVIALLWSGHDRECIESGKAYVRRFGEDAEVYFSMGQSSKAL